MIVQELYTSQQSSAAAATASRRSGATASSGTSEYVATADVLLNCAVHGGSLASSMDQRVVGPATAAILAAAEACGLSVPEEPVPGAVAPPIKPQEVTHWLKLAARAYKEAGWRLQAGQLLLGMGADADGGDHWRTARQILRFAEDKAEVARIYEQAARQELQPTSSRSAQGLGPDSTQGADAEAAVLAEAAGSAVPKGLLGGSFLSASRLLHDAYRLWLALGRFDECRRLLQQYEGLKPLLKGRELDELTVVGVGRHSCC